jgi:hypothetical protein
VVLSLAVADLGHIAISVNIRGLRAMPIILQPVTA